MEIVELNGFELRLSGNGPVLFVLHQDKYGAVARVAGVLAEHQINIAFMQVSRKRKGFAGTDVHRDGSTGGRKGASGNSRLGGYPCCNGFIASPPPFLNR